MNKSKTKTENRRNLPRKFAYWFFFGLYALYAKIFYRIKKDNSVLKKYKRIPHIVLSNHGGVNDVMYLIKSAFPGVYTMVATLNMKRNGMLDFMLKLTRNVVWRRQFSMDIKCLRQLSEIAKNGGNIALFPEGRTSIAGRETLIQPSIVKLIKFLKLPVIGARMEGNYMAIPRWANAQRSGLVNVKFFELFTAEEAEKTDADEMYKKIVSEFKYDEYKTAYDNNRKYKGVLVAEGLQNVLYRCPGCQKDYVTATEDNKLYCKECGYSTIIDDYGRFSNPLTDAPTIPDWYDYEREVLKKEIGSKKDFSFTVEGTLQVSKAEDFNFTDKGKVTLSIDKNGIVCKNENIIFEQNIKQNPAVMFKDNQFIAFYDDENMYKIFPDNKQTIIKFDLICQLLNS